MRITIERGMVTEIALDKAELHVAPQQARVCDYDCDGIPEDELSTDENGNNYVLSLVCVTVDK